MSLVLIIKLSLVCIRVFLNFSFSCLLSFSFTMCSNKLNGMIFRLSSIEFESILLIIGLIFEQDANLSYSD